MLSETEEIGLNVVVFQIENIINCRRGKNATMD